MTRSPLLDVCILRTTTYNVRIGVVSQPFCVYQLNPAGFNVFSVPYKENSRFFPVGRRRHSLPVQPVTPAMIFH